MTETCKDCRFAVVVNDTEGFCYRYPPVFVMMGTSPPAGNTAGYPPILLSRWCGEYVISPQAIEKAATPRRKPPR